MVDRPFPGEGVTGGEGKQEWGLKGSKAHLWVLGIEAGVVGKVDVDGERRLAGSEHGGGVAPVRFGRGEMAWELREDEARLKVGVIGVERVCGGGSAAG